MCGVYQSVQYRKPVQHSCETKRMLTCAQEYDATWTSTIMQKRTH